MTVDAAKPPASALQRMRPARLFDLARNRRRAAKSRWAVLACVKAHTNRVGLRQIAALRFHVSVILSGTPQDAGRVPHDQRRWQVLCQISPHLLGRPQPLLPGPSAFHSPRPWGSQTQSFSYARYNELTPGTGSVRGSVATSGRIRSEDIAICSSFGFVHLRLCGIPPGLPRRRDDGDRFASPQDATHAGTGCRSCMPEERPCVGNCGLSHSVTADRASPLLPTRPLGCGS